MMPSLAVTHPAARREVRKPVPASESRGLSRRLMFYCALVVVSWASGMVVGFSAALTLLTVAGFASIIWGLKNPAIGLIGIAMACALDSLSRVYLLTGSLLRWNTFNYLLILILLFRGGWIWRAPWLPIRLLIALSAVLVLQLAYSLDLELGILHILGLVSCLGMVVYARNASRQPEAWLEAALVTSFVTSVGGLVYLLKKDELAYMNPNAYSYFPLSGLLTLAVVLPLTRTRPKWLWALLPLSLINVAWVYLTGSRGAMMIAALCLIYGLLLLPSLRHRIAAVAVCVVAMVAITARFEDQNSYTAHRMSKTFAEGESLSEKSSGRSDLAFIGIRTFLERPFGVGTGSFAEHYRSASVRYNVDFQSGEQMNAHSAWVKVLAENGIPGFGVFVAFVGSFAYVGWRRKAPGYLAPGLLVSAVLAVAFLSTEFQSKALWFVVAASSVMLCANRAPKRTVVRASAQQARTRYGLKRGWNHPASRAA